MSGESEYPDAKDIWSNREVPDLSFLVDAAPTGLLRETPDDTGNAWRCVRMLGDRLRFLPAEKTWLVWDGTRWRRDEVNDALRLTLDVVDDVRRYVGHVPEERQQTWAQWAKQTASLQRRKIMLEAASVLEEIVVGPGQLDRHGWMLNAPNGTIDLRDGSLRPHDRADAITRVCGVPYDPSITYTSHLGQYINTFMPDMTEWKYVMKLLGAALLAGNEWRFWLIMYGPSTTGKTQLVNAMARALGDYSLSVNSSVFRSNLDDKPRPDLLRALSARMAYALEASENWELHSDHVKRLTGAEPIVARGMRSDVMVERVPDFTPLIVCNSIPRLRGHADSGVRRRLRVLPFTNSVIANEDTRIREKFAADEATHVALLSQLVEGCVLAQIEGLEDIPERFLDATMKAFGELSAVAHYLSWLEDQGYLLHDDDYTTHRCWTAEALYSRYQFWVAMYGSGDEKRNVLGLRQFNAELRDLGWQSVHSNGTRWVGRVDNSPT